MNSKSLLVGLVLSTLVTAAAVTGAGAEEQRRGGDGSKAKAGEFRKGKHGDTNAAKPTASKQVVS